MKRALLMALCAAAVWSQACLAREAVVGMSERVLKSITEAQEMIDEERYDDALAKLQNMNRKRLSSYETAHVLNLEGFVWYQKDNIPRSQQSYEEALAQERLPDSMLANLHLTLGRLGLLQENYDYAIEHLEDLMDLEDQDKPLHRVLLANAWVGKRDYEEALPELEEAIAEVREKGEQPRENWLGLLAAVHYEMQDFEAMREVTHELALVFPREQYFMNLAALYGQMGEQKRQLSLVEALLEQDRLQTEQNLELVANLFLAQDVPYKAATLLERELESGRIETDIRILEQLSTAWFSAAEVDKAIPPLERAAKMSDNGEIYLRVARLYMDVYDWKKAEEAAREAIRKGGLRQEGGAWLVQGMALARMNRWDKAAETFARAADFEDTARYAEQWMAYVESERDRESSVDS